MATAKTKSDALGYYLSNPAGLGGMRTDIPIATLDPVISSPIGPVVIENISPSCGEGAAYIKATSTAALAFKAPGDDYGTAVTVAANTSVLLESLTPAKSVRVYRDSVYNANSLGGVMSLDLVAGMNNVIGGPNATQDASDDYACFYLYNHSDRDIHGISISKSSISGVTILLAKESPVAGEVQTIADSETAPSGLSWGSTVSITTLAMGESIAIWRHRAVGAATAVNTEALTTVTVTYTYNGTQYTHPMPGYFRIGDTTLARYELHVGEDAEPTFASATATSTTLPFTQALSVSTSNHYAVRRRNQFNLESFNILTSITVTGSGGEDETPVLTAPTVASFDAYDGGECDIVLRYPGVSDATPADTWRLYVTTDGTDPDPGTDTPSDTAFTISGLALTNITNRLTVGPYAYGTVVKIMPRVYSSTLDAESANVNISTLTVDTQLPTAAHHISATMGAYKAAQPPRLDKTTYYNSPTNTVGIRTRQGETEIFGSDTVFRGRLDFWTALDFSNVAHSASGTSSPIEVVDANTIYINVNGTRRAKLDIAGGVIEAASFVFEETALDVPVIGPIHATATETYIQIMEERTGRWTPICKVDSSGVFTATRSIRQE